MNEQLAFSRILAEAGEQTRFALDRHRTRVQSWFDKLPVSEKQRLAEMITAFEFDTCLALSAAAGDWHRGARVLNGK